MTVSLVSSRTQRVPSGRLNYSLIFVDIRVSQFCRYKLKRVRFFSIFAFHSHLTASGPSLPALPTPLSTLRSLSVIPVGKLGALFTQRSMGTDTHLVQSPASQHESLSLPPSPCHLHLQRFSLLAAPHGKHNDGDGRRCNL